MHFHHVSVLMDESINGLVTNESGIYVDCTLGGSGHALRIVDRLDTTGHFIGIDQDPEAISVGRQRLAQAQCQVDIVHNNFRNLEHILSELSIDKIDGIIFDLGVSSHQLDVPERGFSYMQDAPLDMRMNPQASISAYDVVNSYSETELARVIYEYGEERWAKRIAKFIVEERLSHKLETTSHLVEVIKKAIPASARKDGPHPAKRTFQAIRIEVNDELGILQQTFLTAVDRLKPKGRICIITFHSLEDRIAKQTLQILSRGCICPPKLPVCVCGHKPSVKILGKPIVPTTIEIENNPRSRSAKLRIAEKL